MGGKHNKRKRSSTTSGAAGAGSLPPPPTTTKGVVEKSQQQKQKQNHTTQNPLLQHQEAFLDGLKNRTERYEYFSPTLLVERRAELWMEQATLGESLVNRYSWATPNETAIRILKEFSPLVEIGCGSNAYWCHVLQQQGIDIMGYDVNSESGGKIHADASSKTKQKKKKSSNNTTSSFLRQGGPEVLASKELANRTLFLCYPDEDDVEEEDEDDDDDVDGMGVRSMGAQCLEYFQGTHVIHVGELVTEANLSMDQAPWGRSSAPEFQERLLSEYHCLLKVELPNWLHVRDTISVWKRSATSTIVFAADDDDDDEEDEEDEEVEYRHIPMDERLPTNVAAPCLAHLLPTSTIITETKATESSTMMRPSKTSAEKTPIDKDDQTTSITSKANNNKDNNNKSGTTSKDKKLPLPATSIHEPNPPPPAAADGNQQKKKNKKKKKQSPLSTFLRGSS
jgi:hypothetical protein